MTAARLVGIAALGLSIAACASATIEDAVPQSTLPPPAGPATASSASAQPVAASAAATPGPPIASVAPRDTGTYPNLNIPPRSAAPQLSDEETSSKKQELRQSLAGQTLADPRAAPGPADLERMREIGRRQSEAALGEAEAE